MILPVDYIRRAGKRDGVRHTHGRGVEEGHGRAQDASQSGTEDAQACEQADQTDLQIHQSLNAREPGCHLRDSEVEQEGEDGLCYT